MGKCEISWKGVTDQGVKREVYAHRVGDRWQFYEREKRYDQWSALPQPPLDDWLELLDGIRRRISRKLLRPEEEDRVRRKIIALYPDAPV